MLGQRCSIVLFDATGRPRLSLGLRAWMLPVAIAACVALLACDLLLLPNFTAALRTQRELDRARLELAANKRIFFITSAQLRSIEERYVRISEFDSKLRIMLSMPERPSPKLFGLGGALSAYRNPFDILYERPLVRAMRDTVEALYNSMALEEADQQDLFLAVSVQQDKLARIPVIWPTRGRFTSRFGYRTSPTGGGRRFHKGIDITAPMGTPIKAAAQGEVVYAGWFSTYGLIVEIDHGDRLRTRYAHLSRALVKPGQTVYRGDVIGLVGNTGRSIGPHLHYEVLVSGAPSNPLNYILR